MDTEFKKLQRKPNIFVIEDNEDIGYILDYYLKEEGFNVQLFTTVAEFLEIFKTQIPDIFLLDVMLPDGNGLEVCDQIKHDPRTSDLPVLIMSAHAKNEEKEDCEAEEFIEKPFDLSFLLKKIRQHLHDAA